MKVLVSGGAGFIGSALIRKLLCDTKSHVVNLDKAGTSASLAEAEDCRRYRFERLDICDAQAVADVFALYRPNAVVHLAAETHVDRSIDSPADFIQANVVGSYTLLEAALNYWWRLDKRRQSQFRFHQVSTDEVYGGLGRTGHFTEDSPYRPNSPYSATKACSDHLVRAWHGTYGLPVTISYSPNNFGPFQFPDKLVPLTIVKALEGHAIPLYGTGENVRDWVHVEDHVRAILAVLRHGKVGESYNISGAGGMTNLAVVRAICALLDELLPQSPHRPHERLISFVRDRPGHDQRYALDGSKMNRELGWKPQFSFVAGLADTVRWYLENETWWRPLLGSRYGGERLGLARWNREAANLRGVEPSAGRPVDARPTRALV